MQHPDEPTRSPGTSSRTLLARGFALAEAPTIDAAGRLLVADVLTGGVRRFDSDGQEVEPLLSTRRGIGGMGVMPDGTIVVSGRDLSTVDGAGTLTPIVALPPEGTGFNDLTTLTDGTVVAGVLTCHPFRDTTLTAGQLAVVAPDREARFTPLDFCWPNGIGISPDNTTLYVADFDSGTVHAGPWRGPHRDPALEPWVRSPTGDADGIMVTSDGNVWVAGGSGGCLLRYDPTGSLVDRIDLPDEFVSNSCHWPESEAIVITTATGVWLRTPSS